MKYAYAYKTSDGTRHEEAVDAPSREAAFAALRKRGIRPIKVVAADGSKANGEVRGGRGRAAVAAALSVVAAVGGLAYWGGTRSAASGTDGGRARQDASLPFLTDRTRRQVIGDAAVVERGIRTGWSDVFASEGDRFLASFAIPGTKAGVRNTTEEALKRALDEPAAPSGGDALEARQIRAMVEGMKREARAYLAAGGTLVGYGRRLAERQDAEIAVLRRAEEEIREARRSLDEAAFLRLYEQRNDELRNLGIRPVTLDE